VAVQVGPQLIPAGALVTVPVPVPARITLSTLCDDVKVAVTLRAAVIVTLQVFPETELHPLQLVKVELTSGVAVRTTDVPSEYVAEHVPPQLIPAGALVTVPVPVPLRVTVRVLRVEENVGTTDLLALNVTVQLFPETESHPVQPVKLEFTSATGVRVTTVPLP
jgi:hypothetical protein